MAPSALMRGMIHKYGRQAIAVAFSSAFGSFVAFNMFYVMPRHEKYEEFFKIFIKKIWALFHIRGPEFFSLKLRYRGGGLFEVLNTNIIIILCRNPIFVGFG
ncbi:hypothetical protein Y032_0111g257 [Ancylostoma ceylanicum]|uniref:Uncharacterized protein n=1 Tax=Ancylostoma ceylanicum TaxID=53326 RepID=A0A016TED9_9BILA|nr:hypothetical protein Y032_0111g257 [Ancylostoma ceylanicum]